VRRTQLSAHFHAMVMRSGSNPQIARDNGQGPAFRGVWIPDDSVLGRVRFAALEKERARLDAEAVAPDPKRHSVDFRVTVFTGTEPGERISRRGSAP
jgi:hypothetical protein